MKVSGWFAFGLWALVGVLYAFVYLSMMSVGIYILVIAFFTTHAAFRNLRAWPEIGGLAVGPAAIMMWLAWRTWQLGPCAFGQRADVVASASGSWTLRSGAHVVATGSMGCTTYNAPVLMIVGVALAVAAVLAYGFCRHRMPGRGQRET